MRRFSKSAISEKDVYLRNRTK